MITENLPSGVYETQIVEFQQRYNRTFIDFYMDEFQTFRASLPRELHRRHTLYKFFQDSGLSNEEIANLTPEDLIGLHVKIVVKNNIKDGRTYSNVVEMEHLGEKEGEPSDDDDVA